MASMFFDYRKWIKFLHAKVVDVMTSTRLFAKIRKE